MTLRRPAGGFTLIEFVVATLLSLIVVLAMGRIITTNLKSWEQGRDKAVLQQNVTEALEWMARQVRASRRIQVVSATELRCYDESLVLMHTYRWQGAGTKLQQDGVNLSPRTCLQFSVTPDVDTTSVRLALQFEDKSGTRVAGTTRATVRNRYFVY
jgi:Tfp pilus assembly protein PilV